MFKAQAESPAEIAAALRDYHGYIGSPVTIAEGGVPAPDISRLTDLASRAFAQRGMAGCTPSLIESIYLKAGGRFE